MFGCAAALAGFFGQLIVFQIIFLILKYVFTAGYLAPVYGAEIVAYIGAVILSAVIVLLVNIRRPYAIVGAIVQIALMIAYFVSFFMYPGFWY